MCRSAALAVAVLLMLPRVIWADGGRVEPGTWWQAWNWDPLVLLALGMLAWLYVRGHFRLRQRASRNGKVRRWQAASYFTALLVIGMVLISPLDALSGELSSLHMLQHMLLINLAAPLFVLGSPTFMLAWGLPEFRNGFGSSLYTFLFRLPQDAILWQPCFLWGLFAATLWAWHHPVLYQAALRDPLIHDAQHLSFFVVACLFWRACLHPFGERRLSGVAAIPYLFATSVHASALGVFLALSPHAWYDDYANRTSAFGFTQLQDQQLAGFIMWMPSCLIYPAAAAILFGIWLAGLSNVPPSDGKSRTPPVGGARKDEFTHETICEAR